MLIDWSKTITLLYVLLTLIISGCSSAGSDASDDQRLPTTVADPLGESYNAALEVFLTCDDQGGSGCSNTYYTLDGTEPNDQSPLFEGPLYLIADGTTILKYFSVDQVGNSEPVQSQVYILKIPPQVTPLLPNGKANNVPLDSVFQASFNEDIIATTITTDTFIVNDVNASITGSVVFDSFNNLATFTPAQPLSLLTTYTAIVTTGVSDLFGNFLAQNFGWSFTTREGTWGFPSLVEGNKLESVDTLNTAIDLRGNLIAVWARKDITAAKSSIWSNRFDIIQGWDTATQRSDGLTIADQPHIAMDSRGNAIAVWNGAHPLTGDPDILASRFNNLTGQWSTPDPIENIIGGATSPQVIFDSQDNAIAVWAHSDGTTSHIWSNRYSATTPGWANAQQIDFNTIGGSVVPHLDVDGVGNVIVVWIASLNNVNGDTGVWSARFDVIEGWGKEKRVEAGIGFAYDANVAMDNQGNAFAVWYRDVAPAITEYHQRIMVSRYVIGKGWRTENDIDTEIIKGFGSNNPQVAFDSMGNALAIWERGTYNAASDIWASRYDSLTQQWSKPELLETNDTSNARFPQISIDPSGNAMAVWQEHDGTLNNIWSARYVFDQGWLPPDPLENDNIRSAVNPQIVIDDFGKATAVWSSSDDINSSVHARRFE